VWLVTAAVAHSVTVGSLELTDLWTRATPPGAPTAGGYLTIVNHGDTADRLIAVSSPIADAGQLHLMAMTNGVMTMRPVADGIEIAPGAAVTLAPGGLHIMFITLKDMPQEGGELPVTLVFEKAGNVETFLHVMAIGATGPSMDAMDSMDAMGHDDMAPAGGGQ